MARLPLPSQIKISPLRYIGQTRAQTLPMVVREILSAQSTLFCAILLHCFSSSSPCRLPAVRAKREIGAFPSDGGWPLSPLPPSTYSPPPSSSASPVFPEEISNCVFEQIAPFLGRRGHKVGAVTTRRGRSCSSSSTPKGDQAWDSPNLMQE